MIDRFQKEEEYIFSFPILLITTPALKIEVDNGAYDSLTLLQQSNTFIFKLTHRPRKGDLHNPLFSM